MRFLYNHRGSLLILIPYSLLGLNLNLNPCLKKGLIHIQTLAICVTNDNKSGMTQITWFLLSLLQQGLLFNLVFTLLCVFFIRKETRGNCKNMNTRIMSRKWSHKCFLPLCYSYSIMHCLKCHLSS